MDNVDARVEGAFEATILAPAFESFEQTLGPIGSTVFENALTQLLERGHG